MNPLLAELMDMAKASPYRWQDIEAFAGVGRDTLRFWFYRAPTGPRLDNVQRIGAVLGLRLAWVPIEAGDD